MKLTVRPLTPDLWPQLEELFGRAGACNGCWCMYWRIGGAYTKRPRDANRKAFKAVVKKGPPPGLLAFADELPVGWAQVTPRAALPHLDAARFTRAVDDKPVWSLSCFYIRKGWRGEGIMTTLIDQATAFARKQGAPALEAYPMKTGGAKRSNSSLYTGTATTFARAGFKTVALPAPHRPTVRLASRRAAR
jgi:GNAT superfamily N-acetyltransferase